MSLRKYHQISHRPKTTWAGQLVCPHCQTAFPLTWRRYWSAPLGDYRCPECRQMFHPIAYYSWVSIIIIVATTLVGIVIALFGA
jgi:hypothetical protein